MAWFNPMDWGKRTPKTLGTFNSLNQNIDMGVDENGNPMNFGGAAYAYDPSAFNLQIDPALGGTQNKFAQYLADRTMSPEGSTAARAQIANSLRQGAALAAGGGRRAGAGSALRQGLNVFGQGTSLAMQQQAQDERNLSNVLTQARGQNLDEQSRRMLFLQELEKLRGGDTLQRLGIANNMAVQREQSGIGPALIGAGGSALAGFLGK